MTAFKRPGRGIARLSGAASPGGGAVPAIGEAFGGGYFAGVWDVDGDPYALVLSPASTEQTALEWKNAQTSTTGTDSETDGAANTLALDTVAHPAGNYCADLSVNGKSDWYLPSIRELTSIAAVNPLLPAGEQLAEFGLYWSSTQSSATSAFALDQTDVGFDIVATAQSSKDSTALLTRAIRRLRL